ncbi:TMAO reductase system periplasmic protein TorT [Paeniglutamicibacter sp.]|uniref:TMAO reductase system periplasmic protein TorT n=1 Tax=Paeniglutamicibacter sp. TaxID=1934391 RepID=UPI0039894E58
MNKRSRTGIAPLALALAVVLGGCSQVGDTAGAERPAPEPVVAEAAGVFADPAKNSPDTLALAATAQDWAVPIEVIDCQTPGCEGARTPGVYTPLAPSDLTEKWSICAVLPHVKDPYWVGQNAAMVSEAQRMGVALQTYEAGGYTEISNQLDQLSNCAAGGADAIIAGAVSNEALNTRIEEIAAQGIPVIDAINGVTSESVAGRALFDYCTLGGNLGRHLKETGKKVRAVWFPGPAGVGSLEQLMSCFKKESAGGDVEMLGVQYGDTGKDAQLNLIENALGAYPEMNYIIGSATTVDAAVGPLAERGLADKINTASYYFTPEVHSLLSSGKATCSSAGNDLVLSRIAVDMALRVLENKPFVGGSYVGTTANVICGRAAGKDYDNLDSLVKELNLPPEGYRPVFTVEAK